MPFPEDELDIDNQLEEAPNDAIEAYSSPEIDSTFATAGANAEQAAGGIQPPKQEFGVLGNVGIGLNLLGILGGVPEARAIGGTLLNVLDRQNQNAAINYKSQVDQAQRRAFSDTISKQYDFSPEDKKILPSLSIGAQSELARAKDRQRALQLKAQERSDKQGSFLELIKELPGSERVRLQNIYKVGGSASALAELRKSTKVDPILKDIAEMQAMGVDLRDEGSLITYFQNKAGEQGQGASDKAVESQVNAVKSRFAKQPGILSSIFNVPIAAVKKLAGIKPDPEADAQYYINPSAPPEKRFLRIGPEEFSTEIENRAVSAGYQSVQKDQFDQAMKGLQSK